MKATDFRRVGDRAPLAGAPDFLALGGTVQVPAAKRKTAWDEVIRRSRVSRVTSLDRSIDRFGMGESAEPGNDPSS